MRYIKIISCLIGLVLMISATAQQLTPLQNGKRISIRGLSVLNDRVFWVSGSGGTVGRSLDGGITMEWMTVTGYEKRDFRDVEVIGADTAIIMGIAEPAIILKTTDGGKNWKKVFEDSTKGMFLDAMYMLEKRASAKGKASNYELVVVGDPINDRLFHAWSNDAGDSWQTLSPQAVQRMPAIKQGEAFFASSGSNVIISNAADSKGVYAVSGGTGASFWQLDKKGWRFEKLPIIQGGESTGANAIAFSPSGKKAVIVGGDFAKDTISTNNCVLLSFSKGQYTIELPEVYPHGFRSAVTYITEDRLVAAGTSGIDVSTDGGKTWKKIANDSYHVIRKAQKGHAIFLAGGGGRIAKLEW